MAFWQRIDDLLLASLKPHQSTGLLLHPWRWRIGVTTRSRTYASNFTSLLGFIATTPGIETQLATTRGALALSNQAGNLTDVVLGFNKDVNQISFNLAEVFVIYGQLRFVCQEAWNGINLLPPYWG